MDVLIKPASGHCNAACPYCFYRDEMKNRETQIYGMMSKSTLENVVRHVIAASSNSCGFCFQGGEPTLAGLDFFQTFEALLAQYAPAGMVISRSIQTNGLLIDARWAAFFRKHNYLVGLSLDGPKDIHDSQRGDGTWKKVMRTAELLRIQEVPFNILTVVTGRSARYAQRLYNFFMKNGLCYQQYIPCLDGLQGDAAKWSLSPEQYGIFLTMLFDCWYRDVCAGQFVYIRYFENLMNMLTGRAPESCGLSGKCTIQYVIEGDGSVYPCDFYALDHYRLGNINENSFDALSVPHINAFLDAGAQIPETCPACPWFSLCHGGCRRDRPTPGTASKWCPAFQTFFAYAIPRMSRVLGLT